MDRPTPALEADDHPPSPPPPPTPVNNPIPSEPATPSDHPSPPTRSVRRLAERVVPPTPLLEATSDRRDAPVSGAVKPVEQDSEPRPVGADTDSAARDVAGDAHISPGADDIPPDGDGRNSSVENVDRADGDDDSGRGGIVSSAPALEARSELDKETISAGKRIVDPSSPPPTQPEDPAAESERNIILKSSAPSTDVADPAPSPSVADRRAQPRKSNPPDDNPPVRAETLPEVGGDAPAGRTPEQRSRERDNAAADKQQPPAQIPAENVMDREPASAPDNADKPEPAKRMGSGPAEKPIVVTDSDEDIRPGSNLSSPHLTPLPLSPQPSSSPPVSPPLTRRRLMKRTSPPMATRTGRTSSRATPKTAPPRSRRPMSDDIVHDPIGSVVSRRETRSSARVPSPLRARRRRYSEPSPPPAPSSKPRARRARKYSRKPVKGDRLRVLWHIDQIYYEGVVDSVLAFRGKRFYDVTYDSGEREYYLDLSHRKWRFADGRDGDDDDDEGVQLQFQKDIDYSKYPQIGDKVLVMWHVDGKYYPGTVNDILKANGGWFYDIDYEGGDREFFLDLTIRKWKYPDSEEESVQPVEQRRKQQKRVARKTTGGGPSTSQLPEAPAVKSPQPVRRLRKLESFLEENGIERREGPVNASETGSRFDYGGLVDDEENAMKLSSRLTPSELLARQSSKRRPTTGQDARKDGGDAAAAGDDVFGDLDETFDILDDMEPPLPLDTVQKRPRSPDEEDVSDLAASKRPRETVSSVGPGVTPKMQGVPQSHAQTHARPVPISPKRPRTLLPKSQRPPSPKPRPVSKRPPESELRSASQPIERTRIFRQAARTKSQTPPPKRTLALQPHVTVAQERPVQSHVPSGPVPLPSHHRHLKTKHQQQGELDVQQEQERKRASKTRVADIVSVAGIVARKWASDETVNLSASLEALDRQVATIKKLHAKSRSGKRRSQERDEDDDVQMTDDETDAQVSALGGNIVALVRRYRNIVEEREKKLKKQFSRLKGKLTAQNTGLVETAKVLAKLDICGLDALTGLEPKVRKKLEIPAPLPPRPHATQAYTHPPAYALSAGVPMQPYTTPSSAPGSLGEQGDAVVRNLRRRLADLVTRSEWLGDEVKRLQGREKTLFKEKAAAVAEVKRLKSGRSSEIAANGRSQGPRQGSKPTTAAGRPALGRPVGITKKRPRTASVAPSQSRGSGKALRKTLPRANTKYKPPPLAPVKFSPVAHTGPEKKVTAVKSAAAGHTASGTVTPATAEKEKVKTFPSELGRQMDKQASELIALTFTVWLLQDESRSEPPNEPGDRMDAWVRQCVKECLRSAFSFLESSSGIMSARRSLRDDVDGENIYTDWILAAPMDDAPIENARKNYSLWEPSLRDSEWDAEKRVLRGLNICYTKALSLTAAGKFSATLMYARAIAHKAVTDFESFMPATITVQPARSKTSGSSAPQPTGSQVPSASNTKITAAVAAPDKTGTGSSVDPISSGAPKTVSTTADPALTTTGSAPALAKAVSSSLDSGPQPSTQRVVPVRPNPGTTSTAGAPPSKVSALAQNGKQSTDELRSAANSEPFATVLPPPSSTLAMSDKQSQAAVLAVGQEQQALSVSVPTSQTQMATSTPTQNPGGQAVSSTAVPPVSSKSVPQVSSGIQLSKDPAAQTNNEASAAASIDVNRPESQHISTRANNVGSAAAHSRDQVSPNVGALGSESATRNGVQAKESSDARKVISAQASRGNAERPPPQRDVTEKTTTTAVPQNLPNTSSSLADPTNVSGQLLGTASNPEVTSNVRQASRSSGSQHAGLSSSLLGHPSGVVSRSVPARIPVLGRVSRGLATSSSAIAQASTIPGVQVLKNGISSQPIGSGTAETREASLQPPPTSLPIQTAHPQAPQSDPQPPVPLKAPSRRHTRSQYRAQSRTSGRSKVVHSKEKSNPAGQQRPSPKETPEESHATTAEAQHKPRSDPVPRMQEVPRKHMSLTGAPRAPLEIPRSQQAQSQSSPGVPAFISRAQGVTQRTYPQLSRNQVRLSGATATSGAPLLSRNQVGGIRRPASGTAQMSVPAAPQRRVAPGVHPAVSLGMENSEAMETDVGVGSSWRRGDVEMGQETDISPGKGVAVTNAAVSPPLRQPGDSNTPAAGQLNSPTTGVEGRRGQTNFFQASGTKKQIGFKSLPLVPPPRRQSLSGAMAATSGATEAGRSAPNAGAYNVQGQGSNHPQSTSAPVEYVRGEHANADYSYGQNESGYSPYAAPQDRELQVDLMNPPTPSSFPGLEGYSISLNADQVNLQRDSLPATPSDFGERYGVQSPINLDRQNYDMFGGRGYPQGQAQGHGQGQGQGQLGHLMNPQRGEYVYGQHQQRLPGRGGLQGQHR